MHFETIKMRMKWINVTGFIIITRIKKFKIIPIADDTFCHLKYTPVKSVTYSRTFDDKTVRDNSMRIKQTFLICIDPGSVRSDSEIFTVPVWS